MTAPRAPANRAELAEVMAHALDWNEVLPFERMAAAVLAALEAAGVRLVPVNCTDEMCESGDGSWDAILAASPYAPEGGR